MPSTDHVLGWYAIVFVVVVVAMILASLLGCGDPARPTMPSAHIPAVAVHAGLIPCWTGDVHRDTIWITPAEVWGIECYCALPDSVDPADYPQP